MKRQILKISVLLTTSFFLLGCKRTFNAKIDQNINYPKPLIKTILFKVGVYYGNDFNKFETIQKVVFSDIDMTSILKIQFGKANTVLFDYILSNVFEKITPISYGFEHAENIDLIFPPFGL